MLLYMRAVSLLTPLLFLARLHAWILQNCRACQGGCRHVKRATSGTFALSMPEQERNEKKELQWDETGRTRSEGRTRKHYRTDLPPNADGHLLQTHLNRIRTAGRVGTKRFVDPCKVFFGNLNYTTTESELSGWISLIMGLPTPTLLHSCKIVVDWKTLQSKGYGFCVFTEPMFATVCLEKCNGRVLAGRKLAVSQGSKKHTLDRGFVGGDVRGLRGIEQQEIQNEQVSLAKMPRELPGSTDRGLIELNQNHFQSRESDSGSNALANNRSQRRLASRRGKRSKTKSTGFGT